MSTTLPAGLVITVDARRPIPGHTVSTPPVRSWSDSDIDYSKVRTTATLTLPLTITFHQEATHLYRPRNPIDFTHPDVQHAIATAVTAALATIQRQPAVPDESPPN